jgi:hypothetical protein
MSRFDPAALAAQQREQRLAAEHKHHRAQRHTRDLAELAGRLRHQITGVAQHDVMAALYAPDGVRLVAIQQQEPSAAGSSLYERRQGDPARFVLVRSGEEAPTYATGGEIPLGDYADAWLANRERARRNTGHVGFENASPEVITRERARLESEMAAKVEAIEKNLPAAVMAEIRHLNLSAADRKFVSQALVSGSERQKQEVLFIRKFVAGPSGDLEPVITLTRWTPDTPRPDRKSLGAGGAILNLQELTQAVHKRAVARERYGEASLAEFPGYRGPVI